MSRDALRDMKKALRAGRRSQAGDAHRTQAAEAALALLERSVRMHHRRLARVLNRTGGGAEHQWDRTRND